MGVWVEVRIPTKTFDHLATLVEAEGQMTYTGGAFDGQRTLHLWPQQPQGGQLAKLILIDEATVQTEELAGQLGGVE